MSTEEQPWEGDVLTKHSGLVYHVLKRFKEHKRDLLFGSATYTKTMHLLYQDLLQEGRWALLRAQDGFNPALGHTFSTYAYQAIWRAMERHFRWFYSRLRHEPLSLDSWTRESRSTNLLLIHIDTQQDRVDIQDLLSRALNDSRKRAWERELNVLVLRNRGITLQAIGDNMGLTRERVRQLEERALDQLYALTLRRAHTPPERITSASGLYQKQRALKAKANAKLTMPNPQASKVTQTAQPPQPDPKTTDNRAAQSPSDARHAAAARHAAQHVRSGYFGP